MDSVSLQWILSKSGPMNTIYIAMTLEIMFTAEISALQKLHSLSWMSSWPQVAVQDVLTLGTQWFSSLTFNKFSTSIQALNYIILCILYFLFQGDLLPEPLPCSSNLYCLISRPNCTAVIFEFHFVLSWANLLISDLST